MRVLAATRGDAASYYRIVAPFSVLRYQGLDVDIRRPAADLAGQYDVLWLGMHSSPIAEITAQEFKTAGARVVYDVDDWLFSIPPSWECYGHFYHHGTGRAGERLLFHQRLLQLADVITCPTEYLAARLRARFPGVRVEVLSNCVTMGDWDILSAQDHHEIEGPVLGWMGTANHWDDWVEIALVIDDVLETVGGHLALMGAPEVVVCFPDRLAERTLVQDLVPISHFGEMRLGMKACDVGFAWATERLEVSRCRSPLKAYQWGAAGVPFLGSQSVYGQEADGFYTVVGDLYELRKALVGMLTGAYQGAPDRARAWQAEVYRTHSYELQARRWLHLLEELC